MEVSERVKEAYNSDSTNKYVSIFFPEINREVMPEQIEMESLRLNESVMAGSNVEFVGGISSVFQIRIWKLQEDVKGKRITVRMHTDGTGDEPVTLFNGIVDSAVKQGNRQIKEITAYDELYTKGNTNVSEWYKSLKFPVTLRDVRDSLFAHVGLEQVETDLPNDGVQSEQPAGSIRHKGSLPDKRRVRHHKPAGHVRVPHPPGRGGGRDNSTISLGNHVPVRQALSGHRGAGSRNDSPIPLGSHVPIRTALSGQRGAGGDAGRRLFILQGAESRGICGKTG